MPTHLPANTMKVTIQNGAMHGLSRNEVTAMLKYFPAEWSRVVDSIVLYQGGSDVVAKFYAKERILGLFWPSPAAGHAKAEAIEILIVALAIVAERGGLPGKISSPLQTRMLDQTAQLRHQCLSAVA